MADLQQIVGAILRDLAKARFASDLYSRSIARYYENDYLLRRFSVPRSDIEEVEIDLKFTITDVADSGVNVETREANIGIVLERTVEALVATFLDVARAHLAADAALATRLANELSQPLDGAVLRIEFRQRVLRYFIESYTRLIGRDGSFDRAAALDGLRRPFRSGLLEYRVAGVDSEALREAVSPLVKRVLADERIAAILDGLAEPMRRIWTAHSDASLNVEIEGGKLSQLSAAAISSVRIKAVMRNLIWTEVKVDEGKYRHTLTAE
jgi:hypothetical protein